jgi:alpha-D-xyloside xylohydrolase
MKRSYRRIAVVAGIAFTTACSLAQNPDQRLALDRRGETIAMEPYAPNILRVTLSLHHDAAVAAPGYGFVAAPDAKGWSASQTEEADVYQSGRIVATVDRDRPRQAHRFRRRWTLPSTSMAPLRARTSHFVPLKARSCWR